MRDGSLWDDGLLEGVEDALYRGDGVGGQGIATSSIRINSLDHYWINRLKTTLKLTV
jgi:hypothetical protein